MDPLRLELMKQRLRERLAVMGLSPNEASKRSGLGLSYVDDILNGRASTLPPHRVATLARTLECPPAWLAGDDRFGGDEAQVLSVARAIEGECRDLPHALKIARLALDAVQWPYGAA